MWPYTSNINVTSEASPQLAKPNPPNPIVLALQVRKSMKENAALI